MLRYNWKFALAKSFAAIVVALVWALRSYTDSWNHTKKCDPSWYEFVLYLGLVVAALTVIELFRWGISVLRRLFHKRHGQSQLDEDTTSLVLINGTNFKTSLLKLAVGSALLLLSTLVGGPSPCEPLRPNFWSLSFVVGCILCGLGLLTIANGVIHEE
jgi:hypothetical protein